MAIAADPNGNIYVSDGGLQAVLVYDSRGKFIRPLKKMKGGERNRFAKMSNIEQTRPPPA
jgi:hypothetical protein